MKKTLRRSLAVFVALACVLSMTVSAFAYDIVMPEEPISVTPSDGTRYMTTTAQRASSEIPLILGVNIVGGNVFNGTVIMGGTEVNDNPDPYIWNFLYMYPGVVNSLNGMIGNVSEDARRTEGTLLSQDEYYQQLGDAQRSASSSGIFWSGGADEIFTNAMEQYGGVGYGVYKMIDLFIGFNPDAVEQINYVKYEMDPESDYYQEGYATYDPLLWDVQTGTLTARAYAWVDLGNAISDYLSYHPELALRYGDPSAVCYNVQEFSFGIPYYIRSLIENGTLHKVKAAWIQSTSDDGLTFTLTDPSQNRDLKADSYSFASIADFICGGYDEEGMPIPVSMTIDQIVEAGAEVIIIGSAGYGTGTGSGGPGGGGPGGPSGNNLTRSYMIDLLSGVEGVTAENAPVIIDSANESVTCGTNGYNFAPQTPLFIPQIVAYLYLEQLAEVNPALNPVALFQFMVDEFMHIKDESAADLASYWIGTKWNAVDSELNKSPLLAGYTYDKAAIIEAIQDGIQYALDNTDDESTWLKGSGKDSEAAYVYATYFQNSGAASFVECITETTEEDGSVTYYVGETDVTPIVTWYGKEGMAFIVENYAAHMDLHIWNPDTSIEGSYAYGMAPRIGIEGAEVTLEGDSYTFTGKAIEPAATVVLDGAALIQDVDYTVSYADNKGAGIAKAIVSGTGAYKGKAEASFEITPASIAKATAKLSATSYTYNGKAKKPTATLTFGGETLVKGTDYTVSYSNNTNAGTAIVLLTGKGNFLGSAAVKTFTIKQAKNTFTKVTTSKTIKASALKSKNQTFTIAATVKEKAKKTFALSSVPTKAKKYITVSSAGKVTVKKGLAKGTYKIKVKITAAATKNYKKTSVTKTITITVK